jgi:TetR/AcrR family transcriptional repressor of nem operon
MKGAGLTHGGFYRHFESREQLVREATRRALSQGSAGSTAAARLGGQRGYTALVDGYLSVRHRDHPESGCAVPCITEEVGRVGGSARTEYTQHVQEYIVVLADLIDNADPEVREREAVLLLSALVGAISMARAVDDSDLSKQILSDAAAALKGRVRG